MQQRVQLLSNHVSEMNAHTRAPLFSANGMSRTNSGIAMYSYKYHTQPRLNLDNNQFALEKAIHIQFVEKMQDNNCSLVANLLFFLYPVL